MKLQLCGITIDAISKGGHYTCIQLPSYQVAIDMGVCPESAYRCNTVFFTHSHTDHMAGVVQHCSTREMMHMPPPRYIVGEENRALFGDMLAAWRRLNRSFMPCVVEAIRPGEEIAVAKNIQARAFRSIHRVPCQGYVFLESRDKLKPEFQGLPGREIAAARKRGEEITYREQAPLVAYMGDSTIEVMQREKILREVKVLIMEVTFFDERVSPENAKLHGHIHLEDVRRNADLFQNERILVMHLSARHNGEEARREIDRILPPELAERMVVLPNG
jgi:ribonuclease Z